VADALFTPLDTNRFAPTDLARGPWIETALHGGPVAALLARAVESAGAEASSVAMQPMRLTVELLRPIPVAPLAVTATAVRTGRKVQWIESRCSLADGSQVAAARAVLMRSEAVEAPMEHHPTVPHPPRPVDCAPWTTNVSSAQYPAFHNEGVEHCFVVGRFDTVGPATDWIRLRVPVVPDEEPSPLQRAAAAADFGNGVSAPAHFDDLRFLNADLTLHLHRLPVGEWVCLDSVMWMSDTGVALAESALFDEEGPIGRSLQSLLLEPT
jgi:acyl-coenzyme A thioesterase PaaI-like protein